MTTNRTESAKKAWETIRARRAAGLPPLSAEKESKPEKDYSGLIGAWLQPAPAPEPAIAAAPVAKVKPPRRPRAPKAVKKTKKRQMRKKVA